MKFQELAVDIIPNILKYLPQKDILNISNICRIFYHATKSKLFKCHQASQHVEGEKFLPAVSAHKKYQCSICSASPPLVANSSICIMEHVDSIYYSESYKEHFPNRAPPSGVHMQTIYFVTERRDNSDSDDECVKGEKIVTGVWECKAHQIGK
jgi:hypothetical protein